MQKWSWAVKEGTELSKIGEFRLLYAGIPGLGISVHGEGSPWLPRPLPACHPTALVSHSLCQALGGAGGQELQVFPLPGS